MCVCCISAFVDEPGADRTSSVSYRASIATRRVSWTQSWLTGTSQKPRHSCTHSTLYCTIESNVFIFFNQIYVFYSASSFVSRSCTKNRWMSSKRIFLIWMGMSEEVSIDYGIWWGVCACYWVFVPHVRRLKSVMVSVWTCDSLSLFQSAIVLPKLNS